MGNESLTVQARALRRAADILGGKDRLRAALHVPMARLEEWLDGVAEPPMDIFLKTVDIISAPAAPTTPPAAAMRARVLQRPSGEIIRSTRRNMPPKTASFLDAVFANHDRTVMLDAALDAAIDATRAQMGNVQLKLDKGLRIVTHRGFDIRFLEFFACVSDGHGAACGAAMHSGARVIVGDVATDPIFVGSEAAQVMVGANARAVQSTPLVSVSGQVLGMMSTHFDHPHRPTEGELAIVDQIARRAVYWLEETTA